MSCFTFLKVMMVLFNLAIALGGAVLLGIGIWVSVDSNSFVNLFGPLSSNVLQFVNVGYLLIAIGAVLFALGFLGCCGAQRESKCLLIMFGSGEIARIFWVTIPGLISSGKSPIGCFLFFFFSIVLIIFIVEVAAAVVALVYTSVAETILEGTVTKVLKENYETNKELTKIWNHTMSEWNCCGLMNYSDFNNSAYWNKYMNYPPFCCYNRTITCTPDLAQQANITGCFPRLLSEIRSNAAVVGGVAAGICAVEIAAMAVAMYLYCHLDEK